MEKGSQRDLPWRWRHGFLRPRAAGLLPHWLRRRARPFSVPWDRTQRQEHPSRHRVAILRDYATLANPRTFLTAGQNDHLAMVADLMGRRFVPTDEVEEGERLAESMVKRLTGNKTLKARFMHKNPFEFPVCSSSGCWPIASLRSRVRTKVSGRESDLSRSRSISP